MFEPFAVKAPAKINLALHVLGRRADGYHDLDSIVAFADVGDELTFGPAPQFALSAEGPFAGSLPVAADNIISRAYDAAMHMAHARGKMLPPVSVHLVKNLPVASGIGGGSSNAAAALRGFLRIAGITGLDAEIMAAALKLGADVPVCLFGRPCRMRGVGERIEALPSFAPCRALLVNPMVEVATPAVFRQLGLEREQGFGGAIADATDPSCWRNDLATPAVALAPVIGEVLGILGGLPGVTRCFMSGSGATCVALIDGQPDIKLPQRGWWSALTTIG